MLAGLIACATAAPAAASTGGQPTAREQQAREQQAGEQPAADQQALDQSTVDAPQVWISESGTASWYGQRHHGRRTASGALFNQNAMTAAHPWLPMGAKVKVTRRDNGQSIIVTITDRLPTKKHIIDLSYGAAQRLGVVHAGIAEVDLEPV